MAYGAIQKISTDFESYPGYWLKGFEQGTTTPLAMATSAAALTLLAKAEVSSGGVVPIGFIKTAGDVIFQPYFDESYDLWLFPTEAEADANDTSNAIQVADNASPFPSQDVVADYAALDALLSVDYLDGDSVLVTDPGIAGSWVARTGAHTSNGGTIITFGDDPARYWERIYSRLDVDFFVTVGDGVADDRAAFISAEAYGQTIGGADIHLDPEKDYGVSASITIGTNGQETYFVSSSKNSATVTALTAFTGGVFIIEQGGIKRVNFTGADKDTVGHNAIVLGSTNSTNPLVWIDSVLNNGGFYDFIKTIYEYDQAIMNRVISIVELGHAAMDLQTGGSFAFSASPRITNVILRNPDITRSIGQAKKYGIIIKRSESAEITGGISNFDNQISINSENREIDLKNLVVLDLRSTVANNLWEDAWAATTAYAEGVYVKPTAANANGHFYTVAAGDSGTSGGTEPTWPTSDGGTVVDGSVTFTEVGESVGISVGVDQQVSISGTRVANSIVALKNTSNANIIMKSVRLLGEDSAILNTATSPSTMIADNCLLVGNVKLQASSLINFKGRFNTVTSDTLLEMPSHKGGAGEPDEWTNTPFIGGWVSTVTGQTNTTSPSFSSSNCKIEGNRAFCSIIGVVTITAANLTTDFKFTLPTDHPMHSATASDIAGTIQLFTGNSDIAICTVISNTPSNATDAAVAIPKKSIAAAGDNGVGLAFSGNFSYRVI